MNFSWKIKYWEIVGPLLTAGIGIFLSLLFQEYLFATLALTIAVFSGELLLINIHKIEKLKERFNLFETRLKQFENNVTPVQVTGLELDNPIIVHHAQSLVRTFIDQVSQLSNKDLFLDFELNSDLRLAVLNTLNDNAFVTLVVSKLGTNWKSPSWVPYKNACYNAAKRIRYSFYRVFIIEGEWEITPIIEDLLFEHISNNVETLIVLKDWLQTRDIEPETDFGLWDNSWVSTLVIKELSTGEKIKRVRYQGRADVVKYYRNLAEKIKECSISAQEYLDELMEPPDRIYNSSDVQKHLQDFLAQPLLNSNNILFEIVKSNLRKKSGFRILIIGVNIPLIKFLIEEGYSRNIDVMDFSSISLGIQKEFKQWGIKFTTLQSLTLEFNRKYSLIILPGLANRLAIWQLHRFFTSLSSFIQKNCKIMLYGLFPKIDGVNEITISDIPKTLSDIKTEGEGKLSKEEIFLRVLPLLHGSPFYDEKRKIIDLSIWNQEIEKEESLKEDKLLSFTPPFKISSIPIDIIRKCIISHFNIIEIHNVANSEESWFKVILIDATNNGGIVK